MAGSSFPIHMTLNDLAYSFSLSSKFLYMYKKSLLYTVDTVKNNGLSSRDWHIQSEAT